MLCKDTDKEDIRHSDDLITISMRINWILNADNETGDDFKTCQFLDL